MWHVMMVALLCQRVRDLESYCERLEHDLAMVPAADEDLAEGLALAAAALRRYAGGKTWRHIATDALEELERRGLLEKVLT